MFEGAAAIPFNRGAKRRRGAERGCVRRTSRSGTENEDALKQAKALLPARTLRLGLRPQPRSDRWSGAGREKIVGPGLG